MKKIRKSEEEWKMQLTPEQYSVLRHKGTERPFTGRYNDHKAKGIYHCAGCGTALFSSETKFESGTGWPSFWAPLKPEDIGYERDTSHFMTRTEIHCPVCGGHLGHVFDDGPAPTGKRYCINSAALDFKSRGGDSAAISTPSAPEDSFETATFAAGCFWGVEENFRNLKGVQSTQVGYTGGESAGPTYEDVCRGKTGHAEAVQIQFDPKVISYEGLLKIFWEGHNPTTKNRQGPDVGEQYRSAIFFHTLQQEKSARKSKMELERSGKWKGPIVTEIVPASTFWKAEEYHQHYLSKHDKKSCHF